LKKVAVGIARLRKLSGVGEKQVVAEALAAIAKTRFLVQRVHRDAMSQITARLCCGEIQPDTVSELANEANGIRDGLLSYLADAEKAAKEEIGEL